jgi:hypothetical protein
MAWKHECIRIGRQLCVQQLPYRLRDRDMTGTICLCCRFDDASAVTYVTDEQLPITHMLAPQRDSLTEAASALAQSQG